MLLQESYPDITPVAGILATQFSTPLSHVNLRAGAWGIPNAGDKKARAKYGALDGKYVYYEVTDTGITLREATAAEVQKMKDDIEVARHVELPKADLVNAPVRDARSDAREGRHHLRHEGREPRRDRQREPAGRPRARWVWRAVLLLSSSTSCAITSTSRSTRCSTIRDSRPTRRWRKTSLETLREAIMKAPIDPDTLDAIYKRIRVKLGGKGVFVRSSSNSEDLPGFNGAGLYDTQRQRRRQKPSSRTRCATCGRRSGTCARSTNARRSASTTARSTWACSCRSASTRPPRACSSPKNLWDPTDENGFTINAKWGLGERVVQGQINPEQVIFDPTNDGTKIITRSDDTVMLKFDPQGGTKEQPVPPGASVILTEERAKKLCTMVKQFIPVFTDGHALDVEWVLEGEDFWIVQARPYVGS